MNVKAPALSGTMDVDEFMAFVQTRPKGERPRSIRSERQRALIEASPSVFLRTAPLVSRQHLQT